LAWLADRWRHRCPICLAPIARNLTYCCRCDDAVDEVRWLLRLLKNFTNEGAEE